MKTRYKIPIVVAIIMVALFVLLPVTYKPIICDDGMLSLDDCGPYLNEKYSKLSIVEHFMGKYPDTGGLGFRSSVFMADRVTATSSLEEKRAASIEVNLEDSSVTYRCYDLNLSEDDHVTDDITNPTVEDIDNNFCWEKRKIKADI